jgi:SsuE family FMN reductase
MTASATASTVDLPGSPVLLIAASPSVKSRSGALLGAAAERLQHHGLSTRTLRIRDLPAQALLHADFDDAEIRAALAAVAQARVVVLATPIYKAAYSGLLKVFLDLLPQDGLAGKSVWTLATGGSMAHLLALDYGLLPVLSCRRRLRLRRADRQGRRRRVPHQRRHRPPSAGRGIAGAGPRAGAAARRAGLASRAGALSISPLPTAH